MGWIVTQGLGADLVTQGWSTASLCPGLINQGLGGPQILLQGLVGTGGAIVISATGGMTAGGSTRPSAAIHVLACGHCEVGGLAPATATLSILAGGGMSLGAAAGRRESLSLLSCVREHRNGRRDQLHRLCGDGRGTKLDQPDTERTGPLQAGSASL